MVHNGIEYGLMQAYAEGFELMHASDYGIDLAQVASLWMHGSVVRSWLLELTARALAEDAELVDARRATSRTPARAAGRCRRRSTARVPLPVLTAALFTRFRSREDEPVRRAAAGRAAPAVRRPRRQERADRRAAWTLNDRRRPVTIVIFGGAGDLAHRKLLPALYNLHVDGLLPHAVRGRRRRPQRR